MSTRLSILYTLKNVEQDTAAVARCIVTCNVGLIKARVETNVSVTVSNEVRLTRLLLFVIMTVRALWTRCNLSDVSDVGR